MDSAGRDGVLGGYSVEILVKTNGTPKNSSDDQKCYYHFYSNNDRNNWIKS